MSYLFIILLNLLPTLAAADSFSALEHLATKSLRTNIVSIGSKNYLQAGPKRFTDLWTRDFAFASRGLFILKEYEVVKNQLELYLKYMRADGLLPRRMEFKQGSEKVTPNYKGAMGIGISIDSNLLVLLTALEYVKQTGNQSWWNHNEKALVKAYQFYDGRLLDGLITQSGTSDWQDNVFRNGRTFYTNLLYFTLAKKLAGLPAFGVTENHLAEIHGGINALFYDPPTGLYLTLEGHPQISLDAHLLAIDLGFVEGDEAQNLYQNLKKSEFWRRTGLPGFNTFPDYPSKQIPFLTKISGYSRYHDRLYWSWLMGLSAKVAHQMGDTSEANRIFTEIQKLAIRDGGICEIYFEEPTHQPFKTLFFGSEPDFSWGSAVILDALYSLRNEGA